MKAGGGGHPNASGCNLKPIEGETYLESLMNVLKEK
jgi:nanoRNase/pAp phosphatase (c-di-AMP/oligoRNAs hydrolase)